MSTTRSGLPRSCSALVAGLFICAVHHTAAADTLRGTISQSGKGAKGYRIEAVRETVVGDRFGTEPCLRSDVRTETIGSTETNDRGYFVITYDPLGSLSGPCSFSSDVCIRVYYRSRLVWVSPRKPVKPDLKFEYDLDSDKPAVCSDLGTGDTFNIYLSPTGCDDNSGLSIQDPIQTLSKAQELVDFGRAMDHVIYVLGGMYYGQTVVWRNTSPEFCLTITAFENERPIFEGAGRSVLLDIRNLGGECTNVTIKGLTIRHYVNYGIRFYGGREDIFGWNGCNVIADNVFENNGDLHGTAYCIGCTGFGVVDLVNSRRNVIQGNVFVESEDIEDDAAHMHAVYFAHRSSLNDVYDNYVSVTSGDPFRVRDASNDNYIHNNYVVKSGKYGFISGFSATTDTSYIEKTSQGNMIEDNVVTFPYRLFDSVKLIHNTGPTDLSTFKNKGQRFFKGEWPQSEQIGAIASGDFDGDGRSELVVALNYSDFSVVVRTTGGINRHLQKLIYLSADYEIHGFATGDFDGSGKDQILTFFRHRSTGRTDIYTGNGLTSLTLNRIYNSSRWDVSAMTAGDFDGDGRSESIVALWDGDETRLYRGNGTSSVLNLGKLYSSTKWRVTALAAGDFDDDDRPELVSGFQSASETRIYRGDGISSALNFGYSYSSAIWNVTGLAAGVFRGNDTVRLVTAFEKRNGNESRLYNGNAITSATNHPFYKSTVWRVAGLVAGEFDESSGAELVTAFTWPTRNQIFVGDGWTTATVLSTTMRNIFHRWAAH